MYVSACECVINLVRWSTYPVYCVVRTLILAWSVERKRERVIAKYAVLSFKVLGKQTGQGPLRAIYYHDRLLKAVVHIQLRRLVNQTTSSNIQASDRLSVYLSRPPSSSADFFGHGWQFGALKYFGLVAESWRKYQIGDGNDIAHITRWLVDINNKHTSNG